MRMPSPVCGRTTLGCGFTWTTSWSTDVGVAADSHPKFTTSSWYFVSTAKVDTRAHPLPRSARVGARYLLQLVKGRAWDRVLRTSMGRHCFARDACCQVLRIEYWPFPRAYARADRLSSAKSGSSALRSIAVICLVPSVSTGRHVRGAGTPGPWTAKSWVPR